MLRTLPARVRHRTITNRSSLVYPIFSSTRTESRVFSTSLSMRSKSLPSVNPPISAVFPSDSFQLLPEAQKAGPAEDELYEQQIKDVEAWWASPRYQGIKRPYSAADVVSKRGSLQQSYPSSVMARKLWNLIQERLGKGEPIHTCRSIRREGRFSEYGMLTLKQWELSIRLR
jgi:isocitrate lyase